MASCELLVLTYLFELENLRYNKSDSDNSSRNDCIIRHINQELFGTLKWCGGPNVYQVCRCRNDLCVTNDNYTILSKVHYARNSSLVWIREQLRSLLDVIQNFSFSELF